ncbi:N-term half of ECTV schlafen-like protein [Murmansk poxvirus]|uniref:N-term half of ECTV schlafen-like protein n=1 Tax=Murmansk poxvirus TaxID=2025359 RepID=A0A223FN24_9POXV|nr:N-term half of ECTV schlafen-like protein [Murmansk poxvirus]AST09372.1 N-term half of ECTV schlafen-like protein [Murmansk poxvirus]
MEFYPHSLGGYDSSLHAFPGLSATVVNNVTNYTKITVNGNTYDVSDVYMWCYSYVDNRYIGGLLPMFECKDDLKVGEPICDLHGTQISAVTFRCDNYYAISGIGYETLDICTNDDIKIHHHKLSIGKSVYGDTADDYDVIKSMANRYSDYKTEHIKEYHIWVGVNIIHITTVDKNRKEISRVRVKRGGCLMNS